MDPPPIDNLDNGMKKASFRLHDEKKYVGRTGVGIALDISAMEFTTLPFSK